MSDAQKPSLVDRLARGLADDRGNSDHVTAMYVIGELASALREMPEGLVIAGQRAIDLRGSVGHPRAVIAAVAEWLDRGIIYLPNTIG